MDIYSKAKPINGKRYGIGFKSKTQLPWLMVWEEYYFNGDVTHANCLFSTGLPRKYH